MNTLLSEIFIKMFSTIPKNVPNKASHKNKYLIKQKVK